MMLYIYHIYKKNLCILKAFERFLIVIIMFVIVIIPVPEIYILWRRSYSTKYDIKGLNLNLIQIFLPMYVKIIKSPI